MNYVVQLTTRARLDLQINLDYLLEEAPDYANQWQEEMRTAIDSLSTFPLRGTKYPKAKYLDAPVRQLVQKRHQIFYQVNENIVEVLHIHHMSQKPIA